MNKKNWWCWKLSEVGKSLGWRKRRGEKNESGSFLGESRREEKREAKASQKIKKMGWESSQCSY
jgi:hypothetical protein